MKFEEALKLMREGKRMADGWCKHSYFFINKDREFCYHFTDSDGLEKDEQGCSWLSSTRVVINTWHEYKEPILDDTEKAYLEAVFRPFREKIKFIALIEYSRECDREMVYLRCLYDDNGIEQTINFPLFKAGTMYKGMGLDHGYTLKELGLFEEEKE